MNFEADIAETVLDAQELHALNSATSSGGPGVRMEIQRTLAEKRGDDNIAELTPGETQDMLFSLAKACWSGSFSIFKRFESLILFDLLQYQHELVEMENKLAENHGEVSVGDRAKLRDLVREYQEAIQRWRSTQELTPMSKKETASWFLEIAKNLREPNYINTEESLEGIDARIDDRGSDSVKAWLQRFLPVKYAIPETQRDRQAETQRKLSSMNFSGQHDGRLAATRKRPDRVRLTPIVSSLATFFIALMGGVSLVVPMVSLIYISSVTMKIVAVAVSVIAFAAMLAVFVEARNHELIAATAAYAAVLVVFLGSPSSLAAPS